MREELSAEVRETEEKYAPFTVEQKAELKALAEKTLQFHPTGLRVISEDQGGYPFEALVIDIAAQAEVVVRCCLAALRALKEP